MTWPHWVPAAGAAAKKRLDFQADFLNGTSQHGEMDAVAYLVRLYSTHESILR